MNTENTQYQEISNVKLMAEIITYISQSAETKEEVKDLLNFFGVMLKELGNRKLTYQLVNIITLIFDYVEREKMDFDDSVEQIGENFIAFASLSTVSFAPKMKGGSLK